MLLVKKNQKIKRLMIIKLIFLKTYFVFSLNKLNSWNWILLNINSSSLQKKTWSLLDLFNYNYKFNKLKSKLNNHKINISLYKYFSHYTFKKIKVLRYAKNIKKNRFNVLNPLKINNNTFLSWFCYNQPNLYISNAWKFMLKKNYKNFFWKIKLWPLKKRTLKWKLQLKTMYLNINLRQSYLHIKQNIYFSHFFKWYLFPRYFFQKAYKVYNKFINNKIFNWYLFALDFRLKNIKKLNRIIKVLFFNLSFFQNFPDLYITIFLKSKLPLKKFKLLNWVYREVFNNFYYSKFHYIAKQYFFSFIFLVWYKNIHFLTYFIWDSFQKRINRERSVMRSAGFFLQAMPLKSFGIIGFKLLIKGKLFKRPRKKIYSLRRGLLPLMNLNYNIKYTHYLVWTRAGSFNFHFWLTFTK